MAVTHRLPGVYFQVEPPPAEDALPRMDIAAFVGFAASGPLHTPVPVEDMARFREIFGDNLVLALDEINHQKQYAFLGPAVEAFFQNGGRRCWVVRVADSMASYNLYMLPGIIRADRNTFLPAIARARSEGSWSDTLKVNTAVQSHIVDMVVFDRKDDEYCVDIAAHTSINKGDLLQFSFGDNGAILYLTVGSIEPVHIEEISAHAKPLKRIRGDNALWFLRRPESSPPHEAEAVLLTPYGEKSLPGCRVEFPDEKNSFYRIQLELSPENAPEVGSIISIGFKDSSRLLLSIASIDLSSPRKKVITVICKDGLWPINEDHGLRIIREWKKANKGEPTACILTFELWAWHEKEQYHMGDLAFCNQHNRFWVKLPVDSDLFRMVEGKTPRSVDISLMKEASDPRFPIAGPEEAAELYLPLGMPLAPDPITAHGPLAGYYLFDWEKIPGDDNLKLIGFLKQKFDADTVWIEKIDPETIRILTGQGSVSLRLNSERTRAVLTGMMPYEFGAREENGKLNIYVVPDMPMQRNGLMNFEADLFLDPELAGITAESLLGEANHKYYLRDDPEGGHLRGFYSLLPLYEVTAIAVPDAAQLGWTYSGGISTRLLTAPKLRSPKLKEDGTFIISWSMVRGAETYILQEGSDPGFAQYTSISTAKTKSRIMARKDCSRQYYYRVRAVRGDEISPWSNTRYIDMQLSEFGEYRPISFGVPNRLDPITEKEGYCFIQWSSVPGATGYILEESKDPEFIDANVIYTGNNLSFRFRYKSEDVYYYRVRAEINGEFTPWSRTQILVPASGGFWIMTNPESYSNQGLLAVQRALLRFCAARGDLLAVLDLPCHYRKEDILNHVAALRAFKVKEASKEIEMTVPPLDIRENKVLSFGSLYHPWIYTNRSDTIMRPIPPSGAVCGILAAGAIVQGAWIAPANVPVKGVVSLTPAIDGQEELFENQVNLLQHEPRGFLIMSASTLSMESDLQPVNVRRLLILLRRLAFQEGAIYVFQPNNEDFHHIIQHKFERLLEGLYARGAFAGDVPSKAFQVVTDISINTPQSIEKGYFIVELKVAPSLPMAFITVRLVQTGNEGYMIEEV